MKPIQLHLIVESTFVGKEVLISEKSITFAPQQSERHFPYD